MSEILPIQASLKSPDRSADFKVDITTYTPKFFLTNDDIAAWGVKTESGKPLTADSILSKTGIERRYVASEQESPYFMAREATNQLLEGNKDKIDAVIVSTSYPTGEDLSKKLQDEFGFSGFHLNIHAACSGVGLGLAYLKRHEEKFLGKRILFVTTEKYSSHLQDLREEGGSARDPSLAQTLFSDGATACTFRYGEDLKVLSVKNHNFPAEAASSIRMPINRGLIAGLSLALPIPYPESGKFEQDGGKVYKLVRKNVPNLIRQSVDRAKLTASDIKMVFIHQGSGHVAKGIRDELPEFNGRILMDYQDGNNSSGSTPKGIMRASKEGGIKKGDIINLTVFGAGLCAISTTLQL